MSGIEYIYVGINNIQMMNYILMYSTIIYFDFITVRNSQFKFLFEDTRFMI